MLIQKERIRLFTLTKITSGSIKRFLYKIPRDILNINGIIISTGASSDGGPLVGGYPGSPIGLITLHFNNKKINILQRYPVLSVKTLKRKLKMLSLNEDVEDGAYITAVYQDLGKVFEDDYPYDVNIYFNCLIQKEINHGCICN